MAEQTLMLTGAYGPYIHNGAHNDGTRGSGFRYRSVDTWTLWGLLDGSTELVDGRTRERRSGPTAFLLPPRQGHELEVTAGSRWYYLRFDPVHRPRRLTHAPGLAQTAVDPGAPTPDACGIWGHDLPGTVPGALVPGVIAGLKRCCASWWRNPWGYARANAELGLLLAELGEWTQKAPPGGQQGWIGECLRQADLHLHLDFDVADWARLMGLRPARFHARFRAEHGIGPGQLLRHLRLERAAGYLRRGETTVAGAAGLCGYRSPAAFARAFARIYGQAPGAYRRTSCSG